MPGEGRAMPDNDGRVQRYKIAILGGGPAGVGLLIRAARLKVLDDLLGDAAAAADAAADAAGGSIAPDDGAEPERPAAAGSEEAAGDAPKSSKPEPFRGICLVESGPLSKLGHGQLGTYAIRSNTFASNLVHHVLGDKPATAERHAEGATGTLLQALRGDALVAALLAVGPHPAPLALVASFMGAVAQLFAEALQRSQQSRVRCTTRVKSLQRVEVDGESCWRVDVEPVDGGAPSWFYAEHVVLALGARQEPPQLDCKAHQVKLVLSDDVLTDFARVEKVVKDKKKVCIVGGAHSAFSCAWLLLHGPVDETLADAPPPPSQRASTAGDAVRVPLVVEHAGALLSVSLPTIPGRKLALAPEASATGLAATLPPLGATPDVLPPVCGSPVCVSAPSCVSADSTKVEEKVSDVKVSDAKVSDRALTAPRASRLGEVSISLLHRSAVKVFYTSKREADADGYTHFHGLNKHGNIHAFGGLRGDAKQLYNDVVRGREPRLRLVLTKPNGSKTIMQRCFDEAAVIIWATGYSSRLVSVFDKDGLEVGLKFDRGQVVVDTNAKVCFDKADHPNLYGSGHGYGLPAQKDDGAPDGSKGRADGIAVYMKQTASLILSKVLGADRVSPAALKAAAPDHAGAKPAAKPAVPAAKAAKPAAVVKAPDLRASAPIL
ncbi:hypothetical protein M885DRAFT_529266 [Pelagophyceae sp. CCMP2097]|nr:hypothetical protein M885DRAFT_529266 [Pelagophyceae sp. CCMP2097]